MEKLPLQSQPMRDPMDIDEPEGGGRTPVTHQLTPMVLACKNLGTGEWERPYRIASASNANGVLANKTQSSSLTSTHSGLGQ